MNPITGKGYITEKDYLSYKLYVYYHAQTEIFDRHLTDLRSKYGPTEAFITDKLRAQFNMYAINMSHFVHAVAEILKLDNFTLFNHVWRYSAQHWIDEYYRLKNEGEFDFINEFICRN